MEMRIYDTEGKIVASGDVSTGRSDVVKARAEVVEPECDENDSICETCEGTGIVEIQERHEAAIETWHDECPDC